MLIEDTTNYEPTGETNESDIYLLQLLTKIANKKKMCRWRRRQRRRRPQKAIKKNPDWIRKIAEKLQVKSVGWKLRSYKVLQNYVIFFFANRKIDNRTKRISWCVVFFFLLDYLVFDVRACVRVHLRTKSDWTHIINPWQHSCSFRLAIINQNESKQ